MTDTPRTSLAEHENPGEASLIVLRGRVRLASGETTREGHSGELIVIPQPATPSRRSTTQRCSSPSPNPSDV